MISGRFSEEIFKESLLLYSLSSACHAIFTSIFKSSLIKSNTIFFSGDCPSIKCGFVTITFDIETSTGSLYFPFGVSSSELPASAVPSVVSSVV